MRLLGQGKQARRQLKPVGSHNRAGLEISFKEAVQVVALKTRKLVDQILAHGGKKVQIGRCPISNTCQAALSMRRRVFRLAFRADQFRMQSIFFSSMRR